MTIDWLIVGAGFTGATLAENLASQLDQTVLLVDRRDHIGGNAYDEYDEHGVLVHRYGPHIFHTNSERVWAYLSRFTRWRPYQHRVLGSIDGQLVPLPFNLNTLHQLFPPSHADRLERLLLEAFPYGARVPILKLRDAERPELIDLAEYIYQKVFVGYTSKQWDLTPEQLDPSVTGRVPVVVGRDDRYFQDRFQAIPAAGYTAMFRRMLRHPNIRLLLNTDYHDIVDGVRFERLIYTGPIDAFFDYRHGELPYRSLHFEFSTLDVEQHQPVGTVNYPNDYAYTRITEQKHLTGQSGPKTTLVTEYPRAHVVGDNDPYYPIPREENRRRYERYGAEAAALDGRVVFAGRLADYKYYNMDQATARALSLFDELAKGAR